MHAMPQNKKHTIETSRDVVWKIVSMFLSYSEPCVVVVHHVWPCFLGSFLVFRPFLFVCLFVCIHVA